MAEKPEKGLRYFLSRAACTNEYADTNACLIEVRQRYLQHLYRAYVSLFKQQPFKDDALSSLRFMSGCATFIQFQEDDLPNMAGLEPYAAQGKELVELPHETFEMLEKRHEQNITRTDCCYVVVDDSGVYWEALDHYNSDNYESEKFWWTEIGIRRVPKKKEK